MFDIHLLEEKATETDLKTPVRYGELRIGDDSETFIASLAVWSEEQYEHHWETALKRVVEGGQHSALITSYVTPDLDDFLIWWPLYLEGDYVYVRNEFLLYSQLTIPFSVDRPWESLRSREIKNAEGLVISDWTTTVESLKSCLVRIHKRRNIERRC